MVTIYGLVCPLSGEIRYIGKTNRNLRLRLNAHVTESRRLRHSHKHRWIAGCYDRGLRPSVWVLEELEDGANWQERERDWIKRAKDLGLDLTNQTAGGEGLIWLDEQSKARYAKKISEVVKRRYRENPEIWDAAREGCRESWAKDKQGRIASCLSGWTSEVKANHAKVMAEIRARPEFKESQSRGSKKAWSKHRDKLTAIRKDPAVRAKQSEAKKKAWTDPAKRENLMNRWTPEAKAKQAAEILSRKEKIQAAMTPEVRARQAAKLRETWAKRKAAKA